MDAGDLALKRLALALPDIPRCVETRSMLLAGGSEVLGMSELPRLCLVTRDTDSRLIGIAGRPPPEAIAEAARRSGARDVVLCQLDERDHVSAALPGWTEEPAVLHGDDSRLPDVPANAVRLLDRDEVDSLEGLPPPLADEMRTAVRESPLAAMIVDGAPASFCYAGAVTETLWDISIDTLEGHRRRGYAALCVVYMIGLMRKQGKEPVWGARESNTPSRRLAARLGFVEVDRIAIFSPPGYEPGYTQ